MVYRRRDELVVFCSVLLHKVPLLCGCLCFHQPLAYWWQKETNDVSLVDHAIGGKTLQERTLDRIESKMISSLAVDLHCYNFWQWLIFFVDDFSLSFVPHNRERIIARAKTLLWLLSFRLSDSGYRCHFFVLASALSYSHLSLTFTYVYIYV